MTGNKLLQQVARAIVAGEVTPSISALRRQYKIREHDALVILQRLESLKIISNFYGNEPRKVLVNLEQLNQILK